MKTIIIFLLFTMMAFSYAFNCQDYSITNKTGSSGNDKPPQPEAPSNLTAIVISSTQINIYWTDNSKVEQGFKIESREGGTGAYTQIATVGINSASYSDTGLLVNTVYYYRIRAYNSAGDSSYSPEANATTPFLPSAPTTPTALTASTISSTQINLSWTEVTNTIGYRLERKFGAGGVYEQIATTAVDVIIYNDTTVTPSWTYYYRVRAYNAVGESGYSPEANATTAPPSAPTALTATAFSYTHIDLSWTNVAGEIGYQIERKLGAGGVYALLATTATDVVTYNDTIVVPLTTYYYRVRAWNGCGNSGYSPVADATIFVNWAQVAAAGATHSIALASDGTVWSWGRNDNWWQLGIGDTSVTSRTYPTLITSDFNYQSFTGITAIFAGDNHNLALKTDGSFWAWGANESGQLGVGDTATLDAPLQVGTDSDWLESAAGYAHTLARKTDPAGGGTLWAWGGNYYGQLGDGTTNNRWTPRQLGTASDWLSIASGRHHNLALKTNRTLWAWGWNYWSQLGDGTVIDRTTPRQIGTQSDWSMVSARYIHTIALKTTGTLWQWGNNITTPNQIGIDIDWVKITAGGADTSSYYSLALKTNNTLWAWGTNNYGQLGLGDTTNRTTISQIGTNSDWMEVAAGSNHTIGFKTTGTLWAWGKNQYGQLGLGDTIDRWTPTMIGE
jgi:alpha-tubulin suppressor-like RCC1 family protein/transcriptional regulator CtsR